MVACFGFYGPLRQYFSLYRAVSQREGERGERIDERKNVQSTPPAPTASAIRPCPTVIKIVGRPGTGSLPSTIAPPDHPLSGIRYVCILESKHDTFCFRKTFLLEVICCPIYHWLEVSRKVDISRARSATTDRQPVMYWATNHLLARLYFDSNTQETTKRQVYASYVSSFPPLRENPAKKFDCNRGIYMYYKFLRRYTVERYGNEN